MNYYLDTEFLEGTQKKTFLGINVGETKPTIDLISIGIVAEDGREYYAISKDFNLKEAWNRWQQRTGEGDRNIIEPRYYWIRENVLKPIFYELQDKSNLSVRKEVARMGYSSRKIVNKKFTLSNLRWLIKNYGKSNDQISEDIKDFCKSGVIGIDKNAPNYIWDGWQIITRTNPKFYAYYADYDWVAFCWLFGKMMNLPNGFPMYCRDLKQEFDNIPELVNKWNLAVGANKEKYCDLKMLKSDPTYPKQENEHNALDDARWNKKLHEFIKNI